MSTELNIAQILKNIYGEGSTQSFESLNFKPVKHTPPNIKYIDDPGYSDKPESRNPAPTNEDENYEDVLKEDDIYTNGNLVGGAAASRRRRGGRNDLTVLFSPVYTNNKDLHDIMVNFTLAYTFVQPKPSAIYIIPPSEVLRKAIDSYSKELSKENLKNGTYEASKYFSSSDNTIKRYLFDWKDREVDKMLYNIPSNFPDDKTEVPLKRMNRKSETYFFTFKSLDDIKVSLSSDMSKSNKLDFVAKCQNSVYVLKGNLPDYSSKGSSVVARVKKHRGKKARHAFLRLVKAYDDLDVAAYHFIGGYALSQGGLSNKSLISDLAKHYSGNFIHTAFEILAAMPDDNYWDNVFEDESVLKVHKAIMKEYKPTPVSDAEAKIEGWKHKLKDIYDDSKDYRQNGISMNNYFINNLKKLYKEQPLETLKADIATAYCNHTTNSDKINYAIDLMDFLDSYTNNHTDYNNSLISNKYEDNTSATSYYHNTPLVSTIYQALNDMPFVSVQAKDAVPILPSLVSELHELNERLEANDDDDDNRPKKKEDELLDDDDESGVSSAGDNNGVIFDARKKKRKSAPKSKGKKRKGKPRSADKDGPKDEWLEEEVKDKDSSSDEKEKGKTKKGEDPSVEEDFSIFM
jgi:hypothetical protein